MIINLQLIFPKKLTKQFLFFVKLYLNDTIKQNHFIDKKIIYNFKTEKPP